MKNRSPNTSAGRKLRLQLTRKYCWLGILCLLSVACSSSRLLDQFHGILLTKIQTDDTKSFVFTSPNKGSASKQLRSSPRQNPQQIRNLREQLERDLLQALERQLDVSGYCRDGYIYLGGYIERGVFELRGECNEPATASDRSRFK